MVEDVRRALLEGRGSVPAVGSVVAGPAADLPFVVASPGTLRGHSDVFDTRRRQ